MTIGTQTRPLSGTPAALTTAARFYEMTCNSKLAPVRIEPYRSATYQGTGRPIPIGPFVSATRTSIAGTCRDSCRFKTKGCYERAGFTARLSDELDAIARKFGLTPRMIAEQEAGLIDRAFGGRDVPDGRPLRLHVGGDTYDAPSARILSSAAARWLARGGGLVWTFTHAWRHISRDAFGVISTLASVETGVAARAAMARGYAPAVVVPKHPSDRRFKWYGLDLIPCPAETRERTCATCRLCFNDGELVKRGIGIAFAKHGRDASKIRLPVLRKEAR